MHYLSTILIIALCVVYSRTLVSFLKMEKGANGCKTKDNVELEVGQFIQDEKTCGVIRCENKDGEGFNMYCQIPLPFAQCSEDTHISVEDPFPRCCWTCVELVECTDDFVIVTTTVASEKDEEE